MTKNLCLFLLALSCFSCSEPASVNPEKAPAEMPLDSVFEPAARQNTAFQIVPGLRIGQVSLQDSIEEIKAVLGQPDEANAAMGKALFTWHLTGPDQEKHQLNVYTVRENTGTEKETVHVHQIRVTSPAYTVAETGLAPGSTLPEIRKRFPKVHSIASGEKSPDVPVTYDAIDQGIAFEITGPDSVCVGISVHPIGTAAAYLPISSLSKP